jgi:RNA polymerase sigma-70 factor (ECF subfamily)
MPEAILERVAAGDADAVNDCIATYGGLVWALARRQLRSHADAEDAVQEIFIDVWRHAGRFDPAVASESTFISTIARRRLIDRFRKQRREVDTSALPEEVLMAAPQEDRAEILEEAQRVHEQMQRLRPDERRVLELSSLHGLSHAKIAEVTDLPLGTVKTHARRGMERLKRMLKANSGTPARGGGA